MSTAEGQARHSATAAAWTWLEEGEGRERSDDQREFIRGILVELSRALFKLDSGTSHEFPPDHWETVQ